MPRPISPLLKLPQNSNLCLRDQIVECIVVAAMQGKLPTDAVFPSCRSLAAHLGVSKNTVFAAYEQLEQSGFLTVRPKHGYVMVRAPRTSPPPVPETGTLATIQLPDPRPSSYLRVTHPEGWKAYPYPFVYNQTDPSLFPLAAWRECSRLAHGSRRLIDWTADDESGDNPQFVAQIRDRILLARGIASSESEVTITLGVQNALAIVGLLLRSVPGCVAVEDPGYPDARNAFALTGNTVVPVPVDSNGLVVSAIPADCKLVYVTPGHQFPTSVSLSPQRRSELLQAANAQGFLVFEDAYEAELEPEPSQSSLRAMDRSGRVLHAGSLSKTLSPGLRLGFLVATPEITREARALRHVLLRHGPTVVQETAALFLSLGHYDAHVSRLARRSRERWELMMAGIRRYLPDLAVTPSHGGSSFWLTGPQTLDSENLAERLQRRGVIIDAGPQFHMRNGGHNSFRLGFGFMRLERMDEGLRIIAATIKDCIREREESLPAAPTAARSAIPARRSGTTSTSH